MRNYPDMERRCLLSRISAVASWLIYLHWSFADYAVLLPTWMFEASPCVGSTLRNGCDSRRIQQVYCLNFLSKQFLFSWMFKGLTFQLPFLIFGYLIQAYCSYKLFNMYFYTGCSLDWHVFALAILFAIISFGNLTTIFCKLMSSSSSWQISFQFLKGVKVCVTTNRGLVLKAVLKWRDK